MKKNKKGGCFDLLFFENIDDGNITTMRDNRVPLIVVPRNRRST